MRKLKKLHADDGETMPENLYPWRAVMVPEQMVKASRGKICK